MSIYGTAIIELPNASPLTGDEVMAVVQNGITSKTPVSSLPLSNLSTPSFLTLATSTSLANERVFAVSGSGLSAVDGGAGNNYTISLAGTVASLQDNGGTGILAKDTTSTVATRQLVAPAAGFTITNNDGVSGNPTFVLANALASLQNLAGVGGIYRVGVDTLTLRSITGTANQITVTNGDGVSGAPTLSITSNPILPGTGSVTLPQGTTGERSGTTGSIRWNTSLSQFEGYDGSNWSAIGSGGGGGTPGHVIQDEGISFAQRAALNFVGAGVTVTDDAGNDATVVTIPSSSTSPGGSTTEVQYNNAGAFGGMSGTAWDNTNRALTITGATVTASNPILNLTQTWNSGATVFNGVRLNITDTSSDSSSLLINLLRGGASQFSVTKTGGLTTAGNITGGGAISAGSGTNLIHWTSSTRMSAATNGNLRLTDSSESSFGRIQLGGTTSSFPAIKRNTTALNFRLADDSADCAITAAAGTFSGTVTAPNVTLTTGGALRTSTSAANTLLLQAYDVDGAAYTTFGTLTANNTPTFDLSTATTIGGNAFYYVGGADVALADGGTGASLADPGADRIMFWDDSANQVTWLELGTNLSITGTTINASGGGGGAPTNATYVTLTTDATLTDERTLAVSSNLSLTDGGAGAAVTIGTDAFTGDVTTSADSFATTIANDAVTFAKMQNITTDRLLGRDTAGSGDVEEISLGTGLAWSGSGTINCTVTGDVTAAASIADNAVVRGDGGAKGVQTSNVSIDDTGNIIGIAGSGSAPSFTFTSDTDTGMYRSAANILGLAAQGAPTFLLTNPASSVNYCTLTGSATASVAYNEMAATGSSSSVGMIWDTKGTTTSGSQFYGATDTSGKHFFQINGVNALEITDTWWNPNTTYQGATTAWPVISSAALAGGPDNIAVIGCNSSIYPATATGVTLMYCTRGTTGSHHFTTNGVMSHVNVAALANPSGNDTYHIANQLWVAGSASTTGNNAVIFTSPSGNVADTAIGLTFYNGGAGDFRFLSDNTASSILQLKTAASAIQGFTMTASATGSNPTLSVNAFNGYTSPDTNLGINYATRGSGSHEFYTNATAKQFQINHVSSAVNYASFVGGSAGNNPVFEILGASTNIGIDLVTKGTGAYSFYTSTGSNLPFRIQDDGDIICNDAAIATSATAGFLWIASCPGTPTGAPTAPYTNAVALVADSTNNKLYGRIGSSWIDFSAGGGGTPYITWSEVTGTSQAAAVNNGYITNNAALVTVTLPATAAIGDKVALAGKGAGGWRLAQNGGQTVHFSGVDSTTGATGSIDSTTRYDSIEVICITANTDWVVTSSVGSLTVN